MARRSSSRPSAGEAGAQHQPPVLAPERAHLRIAGPQAEAPMSTRAARIALRTARLALRVLVAARVAARLRRAAAAPGGHAVRALLVVLVPLALDVLWRQAQRRAEREGS
jgi:hypothetical protein